MLRVKQGRPLIGQTYNLESSYWLTTSAPHPLKQAVDKHNKIIRSGIIIVLTLGSVSNMESMDNRLASKPKPSEKDNSGESVENGLMFYLHLILCLDPCFY